MLLGDTSKPRFLNPARASVVLPIAVIVGLAIMCIVLAVLTSAKRADEVSLENESDLFRMAIVRRGEDSLRPLATASLSDSAGDATILAKNPAWVAQRVQAWRTYTSGQDILILAPPSGPVTYAFLGSESGPPITSQATLPDLGPALGFLRGWTGAVGGSWLAGPPEFSNRDPHSEVVLLQPFMGQTALVSAVRLDPADATANPADATVVLTVQFIDEDFLNNVASRLQLRDLREVGTSL